MTLKISGCVGKKWCSGSISARHLLAPTTSEAKWEGNRLLDFWPRSKLSIQPQQWVWDNNILNHILKPRRFIQNSSRKLNIESADLIISWLPRSRGKACWLQGKLLWLWGSDSGLALTTWLQMFAWRHWACACKGVSFERYSPYLLLFVGKSWLIARVMADVVVHRQDSMSLPQRGTKMCSRISRRWEWARWAWM